MTFLGCGSFTDAIELPPPPPELIISLIFHFFIRNIGLLCFDRRDVGDPPGGSSGMSRRRWPLQFWWEFSHFPAPGTSVTGRMCRPPLILLLEKTVHHQSHTRSSADRFSFISSDSSKICGPDEIHFQKMPSKFERGQWMRFDGSRTLKSTTEAAKISMVGDYEILEHFPKSHIQRSFSTFQKKKIQWMNLAD